MSNVFWNCSCTELNSTVACCHRAITFRVLVLVRYITSLVCANGFCADAVSNRRRPHAEFDALFIGSDQPIHYISIHLGSVQGSIQVERAKARELPMLLQQILHVSTAFPNQGAGPPLGGEGQGFLIVVNLNSLHELKACPCISFLYTWLKMSEGNLYSVQIKRFF